MDPVILVSVSSRSLGAEPDRLLAALFAQLATVLGKMSHRSGDDVVRAVGC